MLKSVVGIGTVKKNPQRGGAAPRGEAGKRSAHGSGTEGRLGNIAPHNPSDNKPDLALTQAKRFKRYELRDKGRVFARQVKAKRVTDKLFEEDLYGWHRAASCGLNMVKGKAEVAVKMGSEGRAGLGNLQSCGSPWGCTVCSSKVGKFRADELTKVLGKMRSMGHTLAMVTLTLQHNQGDPLEELWDAVGNGWKGITTSTEWTGETVVAHRKRADLQKAKYAAYELNLERYRMGELSRKPRVTMATASPRRIGFKESAKVLGIIRAVEVTFGSAGFHPHVHAIVCLEGKQSLKQVEAVGEKMFSLWLGGLEKTGRTAIKNSGGLDVTVVSATSKSIADYITKLADGGLPKDLALQEVSDGIRVKARKIALEATRGDLKEGRAGGRTPFEVLADAADGDPRSIGAWFEFLRVSQGRRQLVIPKGLRDLAKLENELSDEEVANQDEGGETVLIIGANDWPTLAPIAAQLLNHVEDHGPEKTKQWLAQRGIRAHLPSQKMVIEPDIPVAA